MWVAHQAKGTLPKPKGPMAPAIAPMPGTLPTMQPTMGTTPMTSPTVGATSMTSPTVGTTSRPTPIMGTTSRPSSSGETVPGVTSKAVAPVQQTMGPGAGPMVTDATLSYMLRMTGELRSERSSGSAAPPRPAELGLRPVVRPARPVGPVTVEIVERSRRSDLRHFEVFIAEYMTMEEVNTMEALF